MCDSRCPEKGPCLYTHPPAHSLILATPNHPDLLRAGTPTPHQSGAPSHLQPIPPLNPAFSLGVLCVCISHSVMSDSLQPHGLQPTRLLCPWDSPGNNTGIGGHALLQGIFPTQGSNPRLPHCGQIFYHLSHQGNPTTKEVQEIYLSSNNPKVLSLPLPYIHPSMISQVKTPTLTLHSWRFP